MSYAAKIRASLAKIEAILGQPDPINLGDWSPFSEVSEDELFAGIFNNECPSGYNIGAAWKRAKPGRDKLMAAYCEIDAEIEAMSTLLDAEGRGFMSGEEFEILASQEISCAWTLTSYFVWGFLDCREGSGAAEIEKKIDGLDALIEQATLADLIAIPQAPAARRSASL